MSIFRRLRKLLIVVLICCAFSVLVGYRNLFASDQSWLRKFGARSYPTEEIQPSNLWNARITTEGKKEAANETTTATGAESTKLRNTEKTKLRNAETTKPQNSEASKLQNAETTKPLNAETTKLLNAETTKLLNAETTKLRNAETTKPQNSEASKLRNAEITKLQSSEASKLRNAETTKPKSSEASKLRNAETTKPQSSEASKLRNAETTKPQRSEASKLRNAETTKPPNLPTIIYPPIRPIDTEFLDSNFAKLKEILHNQTRLTGHWNRVDELMKARRPVMNASSWSLRSPSGHVYSHEELLAIGNGDGRLAVPNVAHFVLPFGNPELQFHHSVCILSCVWIMRPALLFLWYSRLPTGPHWLQLQRNLTAAGLWNSTVVLAHRSVPSDIYGLPVYKLEHKSDLMRLEAVLAFGGAYFDLDVITLKPLTPLRQFNFTIGRQSADGLCNGVFLGAPNSTFLTLWHLAYQVFDHNRWSALSVNLPHYMCSATAFKHLCHLEEYSMDKPSWNEHPVIYKPAQRWPWRENNYVMHLWYRFHPVQYNLTTICTVDSMLGEMFRFVLFGNATRC